MSILGDADGILYVQRQVQDYAYRGTDFEEMGFLTFIVETYERRQETKIDEREMGDGASFQLEEHKGRQYLSHHPKSGTYHRIPRVDNHNYLPNIVGPWFPRRDGEENTKSFYYASMLALLKPWRDLQNLKEEEESWKAAFDLFMERGCQRDRDVVAGCQYYYESKNVASNRIEEEGIDDEVDGENDGTSEVDEVLFESLTESSKVSP